MADNYTNSDSKRIQELTELAKLTGKEEMLIDNGDTTLKVTVDTLLGYIRNRITSVAEQSSDQMSTSYLHVIHEKVPAESRPAGHYYIRVESESALNNTNTEIN